MVLLLQTRPNQINHIYKNIPESSIFNRGTTLTLLQFRVVIIIIRPRPRCRLLFPDILQLMDYRERLHFTIDVTSIDQPVRNRQDDDTEEKPQDLLIIIIIIMPTGKRPV
jgi:hypothetical protein